LIVLTLYEIMCGIGISITILLVMLTILFRAVLLKNGFP